MLLRTYESILLSLFSKKSETDVLLSHEFQAINIFPIKETYYSLWNKVSDYNEDITDKIKTDFYFNQLANNIQLSKCLTLKNNDELFTDILYQMFWLATSKPCGDRNTLPPENFSNFNYNEKAYIFELARHIYNRSFSVEK